MEFRRVYGNDSTIVFNGEKPSSQEMDELTRQMKILLKNYETTILTGTREELIISVTLICDLLIDYKRVVHANQKLYEMVRLKLREFKKDCSETSDVWDRYGRLIGV